MKVPDRPLAPDADDSTGEMLSAERLDKITYRLIALGFVLLTLVITTGAAWAHYAWGRWWSWDPKETSALVAWLVYLVYLHGRRAGWAKKTTACLAVLGAVAVLFCYVGVNFIGGLHQYGAPEGTILEGVNRGFTGLERTEAFFAGGFLLCYLLAFIGYLTGMVFRSLASGKIVLLGAIPLLIGFIFHTGALIQRSMMAGRLPFSSGYEYAASFAWAMVLLLLIMQWRIRVPTLGAVSMPLVGLILAYGFLWFQDKSLTPLPPALKNMFWLHLHVAIAIISYAALLLATGTAALYLWKSRGKRGDEAEESVPDEEADGIVAAEELKCENCGAALTRDALSREGGHTTIECPYCSTSYRAEEPSES